MPRRIHNAQENNLGVFIQENTWQHTVEHSGAPHSSTKQRFPHTLSIPRTNASVLLLLLAPVTATGRGEAPQRLLYSGFLRESIMLKNVIKSFHPGQRLTARRIDNKTPHNSSQQHMFQKNISLPRTNASVLPLLLAAYAATGTRS